ncbi:hypothetical protein C1646_717948 [Rhizophagus diaphanus]|nr:hypothetical protein C1646_717948 [Rhizophagus diaphanus] [Rhizophagus sp. MUCL 43196]
MPNGIPVLTFSVRWDKNNEIYGSITAWTGYCNVTLTTLWHYARSESGNPWHIVTDSDVFTPMAQTVLQHVDL